MIFSRTKITRMYLPKQKKETPKNPFKFERSRNFVVGATGIFFISVTAAALLALRRVQERRRETVRLLHQRHKGNPRVVIIGAGPCGSALAASVTRLLPETLVTVIEKDKLQVFYGQVPHAHAGHRSYDINTSGGWDFLRSPTTWNVTREALLVSGVVVKVDPVKQKVMVREDKPKRGTASTSARSSSPSSSSSSTPSTSSPLFGWLSPFSFLSKTGSTLIPQSTSALAEDDSEYDTVTGLRVFPYDVLVIASGAERTLGSLDEASASVLKKSRKATATSSTKNSYSTLLQSSSSIVLANDGEGKGERGTGESKWSKELALRKLRSSDLEKGSIALHPGTSRDLLAHLFKGDVLHVKVPPASFAHIMELWQEKRAVAMEGEKRGNEKKKKSFFSKINHKHGQDLVGKEREGEVKGSMYRAGKKEGEATVCSSSSLQQDVGEWTSSVATSLPHLHNRDLWAFQRLQYPTRQDDATFVSTTNLVWKFLCYFNKLYRCPLRSISADAAPFPSAGAGENSFSSIGTTSLSSTISSSVHQDSTMGQAGASSLGFTNKNSNNNSSNNINGFYFFSEWNDEVLSLWKAHQDWGAAQSAVPDLLPPSWGPTVQKCFSEVGRALCSITGGGGMDTNTRGGEDILAAQLATAAERASQSMAENGSRSSWDGSSNEVTSSSIDGGSGGSFSSSNSSGGGHVAFQPLHYTYIESVDPIKREVLLVHYPTGKRFCQSYRVLLLDLPMKAAGRYIEDSKLHHENYVEDVVLPQITKWKEQVSSHSTICTSSSADSPTLKGLSLLIQTLESLSLPQLREVFKHEASFVNVDPETLQHRQYNNIFAIGDAAGLPTIKSYAAGFTQVPVVSFNIQRVLHAQQEMKKKQQKVNEAKENAEERRLGWLRKLTSNWSLLSSASSSFSAPKEVSTIAGSAFSSGLARYNGYTSFHVVMTPWRCMWPSFTYGTLPDPSPKTDKNSTVSSSFTRDRHHAAAAPPSTSSASTTLVASTRPPSPVGGEAENDIGVQRTSSSPSSGFSPDAPLLDALQHCHTSWRGIKGLSYGLFCQSAMYELLYFFVFMRGLWYPPRWFAMPTFSPVDGSEVTGGSWLKDLL